MHPTLDVLKNTILPGKNVDLFLHIAASNLSGQIYNKESLKRIWAMSPYSQVYYSILNPLFSALLSEVEKKDLKYPFVLIRDGIVDFLQYMIDHPVPDAIGSSFIFDRRLEPYLSSAWREKALFYSLYHQPAQAFRFKSKPSKLIISTIINDGFICMKSLKKAFLLAKKFCDDKKLKIEVHLPVRENIYFDINYQDTPALLAAASLAYEILGTDLSMVSDKKMETENDFRDYFYFIPADGNLCLSDNYLEHLFLMKGATPMLEMNDNIKDSVKVPLSTEHGMNIFAMKPSAKSGTLFNDLVKQASGLKEETLDDIENHRYKYFVKQETFGNFFHYIRSTLTDS